MTHSERDVLQCLTSLRNYLHGAPMSDGYLAYNLRRADRVLHARWTRPEWKVKDDEFYLDLAHDLNRRRG